MLLRFGVACLQGCLMLANLFLELPLFVLHQQEVVSDVLELVWHFEVLQLQLADLFP